MAREALVTFDLGTTRLKVAAFSVDGTLLAQESARHREYRDGDRAYQDPDEWWTAACSLTRRLVARAELDDVELAGLSLSGRGGVGVFLDEASRVLMPAWSDRRHAQQLASLSRRAAGAEFSSYAAALISKLLWLREREPEVAERVAHALYAKDFLLYRMTGRAITDPTSGPDSPEWPEHGLAGLDVSASLLPSVAPPWELAGSVTAEAASELGVRPGVPVAVGGHDGICANVGAGAGGVGAYAVTIGTHAVVRAITARHPANSHRFYGLPPDRHVIGGNAVMAGRAADWFLDAVGAPADDEGERAAAFRIFDEQASVVHAGADGVRFLPFLAGQRAPEQRHGAAAAFTGLRADHGRAHMYRAVLEGGAFAMRGVFEQVRGWCGAPTVVRFTGSGAQSEVWRQIIVNALNVPIELTDASAEGRGAAIFLAVALGYHRDYDSAADAMVRPAIRVEPETERATEYERLYADWRAVAETLKPLDR